MDGQFAALYLLITQHFSRSAAKCGWPLCQKSAVHGNMVIEQLGRISPHLEAWHAACDFIHNFGGNDSNGRHVNVKVHALS